MAPRIASRLAIVCLVAAFARSAHADEPSASDKNLAQSLFDDARRLMDQGHAAEACPRFAESERLAPGGGTALNLAHCYEQLGKLVLAYNTYNEAISLAVTKNRHEREKFARDRVAALAPRLPHLTLRVRDDSPGIDVRLDGAPVPAAAWGTAIAVDPGEHAIEATAPARASWKTTVTVTEGEAREVEVALVAATTPPASAGVAPVAVIPAQAPYDAPLPASPPAAYHSRHRSAAFDVLAGVAVTSLVVSAVTGGMAWSAHESVAQKCNLATDVCFDPTGISDASHARTLAWVSTATLGGGVLIGLAAFMLPLNDHVAVGSVAGGPGISLNGSWR